MNTPNGGRVAWIAIAPVKAMAIRHLDSARLETTGIAGDRAFAVLDEQGRLVNGKRIGPLARIVPSWDPASGALELAFPDDGGAVAGVVELGEAGVARLSGGERPVREVVGPWTAALARWTGQPVRLVAFADPGIGMDRGPSATLLSAAALADLAAAGGETEPLDPRRFRMTFGIDGMEPHVEDRWIGRDVRVGDAIVRPAGNVGRCAVTTQDPDTGRPTFDTLRLLQETRGHLPTSEPLPFGVWAEVVRPGDVRVGDPLGPA